MCAGDYPRASWAVAIRTRSSRTIIRSPRATLPVRPTYVCLGSRAASIVRRPRRRRERLPERAPEHLELADRHRQCGAVRAVFFEAKLYADMGLQVIYAALSVTAGTMAHGGEAVGAAGDAHGAVLVALSAPSRLVGSRRLGMLLRQARTRPCPTWTRSLSRRQPGSTMDDDEEEAGELAGVDPVDVLYVGMFIFKHLYLTAGLYAVFLALAVRGYLEWRSAMARPVRGLRGWRAARERRPRAHLRHGTGVDRQDDAGARLASWMNVAVVPEAHACRRTARPRAAGLRRLTHCAGAHRAGRRGGRSARGAGHRSDSTVIYGRYYMTNYSWPDGASVPGAPICICCVMSTCQGFPTACATGRRTERRCSDSFATHFAGGTPRRFSFAAAGTGGGNSRATRLRDQRQLISGAR